VAKGKVTKAEAEYVRQSPDYQERRCYICTMFRPPRACTLVTGRILAGGVCKWFELDERFSVEEASKPVDVNKDSNSDSEDTPATTATVAKRDIAMTDNLRMYLPLTKIDAVNRLVYGIATEEKPDRSNEIFDYFKSKPHYESWSQEISKATDGKSLGNLRAMHSKIAAGKLTELTFNDAQKRIEICAKVVDDNEWEKVVSGVYTGFSQGGSYIERFQDPERPNLKRYVAAPTEISLVDLPCLPTATFQMIKSAGPVPLVEIRPFSTVGSEEEVGKAMEKFYSGELTFQKVIHNLDPDDTPASANTELSKDTSSEGGEGGDTGLEKHNPGNAMFRPSLDTTGTGNVNLSAGFTEAGENTAATTQRMKTGAEMVDGMASNTEMESGAHEQEPKTRQGNPDNSPGGVNSTAGSGGMTGIKQETSMSGSGTPPGMGKESDGDMDDEKMKNMSEEDKKKMMSDKDEDDKPKNMGKGDQHTDDTPAGLSGVTQMWLAKDGKPFQKKADAVAYNEKLEQDELVKNLTGGVSSVLSELASALDRIDGGSLNILDANAMDAVWQEAQKGTQTRAGAQPLGKVYASVEDIPPAVKEHFKDAKKQRQWMHVWNNVYKQSGDEQKAFAQAWAAAEKELSVNELEKAKKPYGDVEYADTGFLPDGIHRLPLDNPKHIGKSWAFLHMPRYAGKYSAANLNTAKARTTEAWKAHINPEGPPNAAKLNGADLIKAVAEGYSKHLYDVGEIACTILRLYDLKQCLEMEAIREGDSNAMATKLGANISSLCDFLRALVVEETEELVMGTEDMMGHTDEDEGDVLVIAMRAAVGPNATYLGKTLHQVITKHEEAKAAAVKEANPKATYKMSPATRLVEALQKVGRKMGQVNRMHLQAAHDHVSSICDGEVCEMSDTEKWQKAGAKLSKETRDHLKNIHDKMSDLGADCSMSKGTLLRHTTGEIATFEKSLGIGSGNLAKVLIENEALKKALDDTRSQVSVVLDRVKKLEETPLPAKGVKRLPDNVRVLEKDGSFTFANGGANSQMDVQDKLAEVFRGMTSEQISLELIKIAQRNPVIRTVG